MPFRSFDFRRIYNEFLSVYPDVHEAERLYNEWIKVMGLDETREYGQARESYYWKKEDLTFVKEDADNKYYEVEIGFPSKSMNGNVYKKRDLVAAAATLEGKHPSLNHKDEFWFSPENKRNRWGVINIVDGKFHEGICKALIQVPKSTVCPICDGKPMTELIDNKHIVNVSLEGDCAGGFCGRTGTCEGFYFTDPPFTFLTTDVLPGFPMSRIKPLEAYLPISQSSNNTVIRGKLKPKIKEENKMTKRILKPRIIEDDNKNVDTKTLNPDEPSQPYHFKGTWGTELTRDEQIFEGDKYDNARTVVGTSPARAFTSGNPMGDVTPDIPRRAEAADEGCGCPPGHHKLPDGRCMPNEQESTREQDDTKPPEFSKPASDVKKDYAPMAGPSDDEKMPKPEDEKEGPSKTAPPTHPIEPQPGAPPAFPTIEKPATTTGTQPPKADDKIVTGAPPKPAEQQDTAACPEGQHRDPTSGLCVADSMEEQEPCADGYHRDAEGNCVPDEPLDERVKRIKAETREAMALGQTAKLREDMGRLETLWIDRYTKLDRQLQKANAYNRSQDRILKEQRDLIRKEQLRCEDLRVEIREVKNQFSDSTSNNTKYARLIEDLKIENAELNKKYHGALQTNLELSKKVTRANEEYLDLAKLKEQTDEQLKKARIGMKKTLRLTA